MHKLQFTSVDPLDHVCRTLDTMRKMGFALSGLRVEQAAQEAYRVSIDFNAQGAASVDCLVDRVSNHVGVGCVTHEGMRGTD